MWQKKLVTSKKIYNIKIIVIQLLKKIIFYLVTLINKTYVSHIIYLQKKIVLQFTGKLTMKISL